MTWVQRVKRVREQCADLLGDNGWRWRVAADVKRLRFYRSFARRRPGQPGKGLNLFPQGEHLSRAGPVLQSVPVAPRSPAKPNAMTPIVVIGWQANDRLINRAIGA